MNVKEKSFEELFTQIQPDQFINTLSGLTVQKDHRVITAGTDSLYNSMAAAESF